MLSLSLFSGGAPLRRVLAIGCRADDVEIGCGGTLLALTRGRSVEVTWVVLGAEATGKPRRGQSAEEFLAAAARADVVVHGFRDACMPYHGESVKEAFDELGSIELDLVIRTRATTCTGFRARLRARGDTFAIT